MPVSSMRSKKPSAIWRNGNTKYYRRQAALLATIKHLSSKNSDYGAAERYLIFQHNEITNQPILDKDGHLIPREDYRIDSVLCGEEDFAIACMKANLSYNKNLSRADIKSHHYIISFDPRDAEDNGLSLDRAQELGLEFCKKHFAGHQALVCTHPDGHNKSGNIHVHIVINSLRVEQVPRMPYMDKDCDMLPGMKHRCTAAALRYLRAEVMEMCQREGLYQIDLLNGSKERITEKEYRAQCQGQKKLDEENAKLIASGEEPKQTKFETDKAILRRQIRAALSKSKTPAEFADNLLKDYGIIVKESRGRFSYLSPDRAKPITSRKLGNDFSKDAILATLEKNAARVVTPVQKETKTFSPPRNEDEIRKLIDLDAKRAEGKGEGYIQWAKLYNLKMKAKTLLYLQEHKLTYLEDLYDAVDAAHEKTKEGLANLKAIEAELAMKKDLQKQVAAYRAGKKLYDEYKTLPKKKQQEFYENNRQPLMLFEASVRYFKQHDIKKLPSAKALRDEIEDLISKKNDSYNEYREAKAQEKELQLAKNNILETLEIQEPARGEKREK